MSSPDDLQIGKCREVGELGMMRLDVDVPCHLLQGLEHLQFVRVHLGIARSEGEVLVDLLEPVEAGVEDGEAALQDGAVLEALDVSGVDRVGELADLGTGPVTGHTLPVNSLQHTPRNNRVRLHHRIMIIQSVLFSRLSEYTNILF